MGYMSWPCTIGLEVSHGLRNASMNLTSLLTLRMSLSSRSAMGSNASMSSPLLTCTIGFEVSHGLKRFYEPDFVVDTNNYNEAVLMLEVNHGLERFYEHDLCRHVHQDRNLEVSHGLRRFYELDFIVDTKIEDVGPWGRSWAQTLLWTWPLSICAHSLHTPG